MRGTWDGLQSAFPGWRAPSPGERVAFDPITPPLPYASLDLFVALGYWSVELFRFYLRLYPDDAEVTAIASEPDVDVRLARAFPEAIVGHGGTFSTRTRTSVHRVPARLRAALASLVFETGSKNGPMHWLRGEPAVHEKVAFDLARLRDLARTATANNQDLWLIGIHEL